MSSALTTLERIRAPIIPYGHVPGAPEAAAPIEPVEIFSQAILRTPSTDDELGYFVEASASGTPLAGVVVEQFHRSVTQWLRSLPRTEAGAELRALPHLIVEVEGSSDAAIWRAILATINAALQPPGVLLGAAWPHHFRLSQNARTADARSERFKADDFSDLPEIHRDTVDRAVACLNLLPPNVPAPQTSPSPDGEIGLFWFQNNNRVEAYFDREGHFTWIGKFDDQFDRGGDVEWHGILPDAFVRMLTRLYS